jgi:TetR/AcrR family transcriptional regulator, transcriptional repressor for nem operon
MRRSREDAAETRRRIVETASRLFRLRGITTVSVADIMGELGLTVGGFYRHFDSKEALVVEAIEAASDELVASYADTRGGTAGAAPASVLLDRYLSRAHRDHAERGCPVAALCADVAHEGSLTKKAFTKSVRSLLEIVARLAPDDTKDAHDRRLHAVASMVGAVVLSRATSDEALADDLLRVVRAGVLQDAPRAAGKAQRKERGAQRSSMRAARTPANPSST